MTTGPDQPSGASEFAPLESTPRPDPYAPVDYPTGNAELPPPVYGAPPYPQPGFQPPAAYPPPGYPTPAGYPPPGYPTGPGYPQPPAAAPYGGSYPYAADPYDPYRQMRPLGTNGKAIAALVTSAAGLFFCGVPSIVGVILGIIAMRETRRTGQEGYGLALAGTIIGGLVTAGFLIYLLLIFGLAVSGWSAV